MGTSSKPTTMKHPPNRPVAASGGNILIITLVAIALLSIMAGSAFQFTTANARLSERAELYAATEATAEGLLEIMYAQWLSYVSRNLNFSSGSPPSVGDFGFMQASIPTIDGVLPNEYTITEYSVNALDSDGNLITSSNATPANQNSASLGSGTIGLNAGVGTYWYLGVVELTRGGRYPMTVRLGRVFSSDWASLLDYAFFGENDTGIFPGPQMDLVGKLHTNGNLYYGHGSLNFYNLTGGAASNRSVTSAGFANNNYPPGRNGTPADATWNSFDSDGEAVKGVKYKSMILGAEQQRAEPLGINPLDIFDTADTNSNNDGYRELLERPDPSDPDPPNIAQLRFYNQADVKILVDSRQPPYLVDANGVVQGPNPNRVRVELKDHTSSSPDAVVNITPDPADPVSSWNPAYQGVWESMGLESNPTGATDLDGGQFVRDNREGADVFMNTVDVNALATSLGDAVPGKESKGFNGGVYVSDVSAADVGDRSPVAKWDPNANNGMGGYVQKADNEKAVRLENGAIFPDELVTINNPEGGISIVSDNGIYIQGDYNSGRSVDSSGNVLEDPPSNTNASAPKASDAMDNNADGAAGMGNNKYNDFVEADGYDRRPALVGGDAVMILSNSWDDANASSDLNSRMASVTTMNTAIMSGNIAVPSGSNGYSGGVENFPRFLEKWSGVKFNYYGSMIQLWRSEYFGERWGKGNVYSAPNRRWYYDNMFKRRQAPMLAVSITNSRGMRVRLALP